MCTDIHPRLHPKLKNFSFFSSFHDIISDNEVAQVFLEEMKIIPSSTSTPPICCGLPMRVEKSSLLKLNWRWRCSAQQGKKKKGLKCCRKIINPSEGTFFEGTKCRIDLREIVAIVICFVMKMSVTDVTYHLRSWRYQQHKDELSDSTVSDYFSCCREIAEIISSHHIKMLGGVGKTVQIDETFLTKRKYHRGRVTEQMSIVVLGLYCKEDKTGVFIKVDGKSKRYLWPYIKKFVDPNTSIICTDQAKQYHGVEQLFGPTCTHLTTNHSVGEFVAADNSLNTINDLENQNKLFKKSIISRKSTQLLYQYMALYYYRKNILEKQYRCDLGSQIMQFFEDMAKVYPGYIDGQKMDGLFLKNLELFSQDEEDITDILPPLKRHREMSLEEEFDFGSDNNSDDDSSFDS